MSDAEYAEFVRTAWQRHLRLAILLTGDRLHAEELLQDCLVRMYVRWHKLVRREDLHAYLRRAITNGQVSSWRRSRRESPVAELPDQAMEAQEPPHETEQLRRALLSLPQKQRAVVVLRHYEDLGEQQIASILGCTVGTVKSQHSRAIKRLRALVPHDIGKVEV